MSALSAFGFRVALPLSPNGFGRRAVASLFLPLLSLSFLLSPQQAAAQAQPQASLVLSPASITEAGGTSTVTARLDRASGADTMVTVSAASAYTLGANADLLIPAGETESSGLVTITAVDNNVHGWDRQVEVSASAANSEGVSGPDGATLTITNDDPEPTVTLVFTPNTFMEGGESEYRPHLSHPSEAKQTVVSKYYLPWLNDIHNPAYKPPGQQLGSISISSFGIHVPAGDTVGPRVRLTFHDNNVDAPDSEVELEFTTYNEINDNKPTVWYKTLTILDDDGPPTVTLKLSPASIAENGGTSRVTARLSHPSSRDTTVTVSAAPVSPAAAGDYRLSSNLELLIPALETKSTGTVTITGVDNDLETPDKQVTVSGVAANTHGITNPDATTLTLSDDDDPALSIGDAAAAEGDSGGAALEFRVALDQAALEEVRVDWATADGTAQAGADYRAASGSLTFGVGEISKTVSVTASGDNVDEPNETFTVRLSNASGATLGKAVGTGTITDDDDAPTVTLRLSPASVSENGGESAVTARLSHPSSADTTVTVSGSDDYRLGANGALTIPAGATESAAPVTLTALDNRTDAPEKLVTVSAAAANAQGIEGPQAVTLTITDDDGAPTVTLRLSPASISENGGESAVTARLSHPSSADTTVTVSGSSDYRLGGNAVLTIPAGATESVGAVTVTGVDDDLEAPDKAVAVSASATNEHGVLGPQAVTLTITDDERRRVSIADARLAEGDSGDAAMEFAVTLTRAASGEVRVDWETSDGTAEAGTDYRSGGGTLRFGAGETERTVAVSVLGDRTDEPNETFRVRLSNASGAALGRALATGRIGDDDAQPTAALSLAPDTIGRSGGMSRVAASLSNPSSEETTVTVSPATSGDYALSSNRQLRIPAGATQSVGLVTVTAVENGADLTSSATSTRAIIDPARKTVAVSATAENDWGVEAPESVALTISGPAWTPFLPPADDASGLEGFVRILNHSDAAGEVAIEAVDDAGVPAGTVTLPIAANAAAHFNSADLERGNPGKGLAEGVGAGQGGWRLVMRSALPITALSYVRASATSTPAIIADGLLAPMHDVAPVVGDRRHVAIFNPASNLNQMSRLRLVNLLGGREAEVSVAGTDSAGVTPEASASVAVPAGGAAELTADRLEAALGDGEGKWRLAVRPAGPILAMSLLANPSGHLANLSSAPAASGDGGAHVVPLFPSASDAFGRQGFVQVANRSAEAGEVTVAAYDDSGRAHEALTLAVGAGATAHFNSDDLELGNAEKGLTGGTGPGAGDWRLALTSGLDLEVLAYVRMPDGFLASMHDVAPTLEDGAHWIATFNPASNPNQASRLRLVNPGAADAAVTITGMDDEGASPGAAVTLTVPAGASRTLGAAELESGADGLDGALGDGTGKWRLRVVSDQPILAMSLVAGPGGRLANLSSAPRRGVR